MLQTDTLLPLLKILSQPNVAQAKGPQVSLARQATWAVSNMCRGSPPPPHDSMRPAYPVLAGLVQPGTDAEVLSDACWALSYLSDGPNDRIQAVIDTQVTRKLVDVLGGDRGVALVPALRIIGNIVTGDDTQTQVAINCGALQQLRKLLANSQLHRPAIIKEACWALSNITAGTKEQVDAVIASGSIQEVIRLLRDGCTEVRREALWAISNAASNTEQTQVCALPINCCDKSSTDLLLLCHMPTARQAGLLHATVHLHIPQLLSTEVQSVACTFLHMQVQHLVQLGCLKPMVDLLKHSDGRIVLVSLEGLRAVLTAGEVARDVGDGNQNYYALELESVGGLDALEDLQNHDQAEVQEKAISILTTFYEIEAEEENVAPAVDTHGNYAFPAQQGSNGMATDLNFAEV